MTRASLAKMRFRMSMLTMCSVKQCAMFVGLVFVFTSFIANIILIVSFWSLYSMVSNIVNTPSDNFLDKLAVNPMFQNMVQVGKEGGFASLLENIVGRVYIESPDYSSPGGERSERRERISRLGVDVSSAGEAMYIYQRILTQPKGKWKRLVVDIGANDGLLSSNSYNFIQWGWNAILVEPQEFQLGLAKRNIRRLKKSASQRVQFLAAAIGDRDGTVQFTLSSDIVSMESHLHSSREKPRRHDAAVITVPCYSVKTFISKFDIPKHFGILSIDAEGMGTKILYQWIRLGYRPAYIIHEELNDPEHINDTTLKLERAGYTYLTRRGWNHIFEYNPHNQTAS